jgi:hypothetical protein
VDGAVVVSGREFTPEILTKIREQVAVGGAALTRAGLSREVCEWLNWRDPMGRLQEMSCRRALQRLSELERITLPVARAGARRQPARYGCASSKEPVIRCALDHLGKIAVVEVSAERTPELSKQWNDLIAAHHYLGYVPAVGRQKRYLIMSERQGCLGASSFSAAAWRCTARDRWIGWNEQERRAHLQAVIAQSRFLILPWVQVKNLASHLLARLAARVVDDWRETYGYAPLLLETYVLGKQFAGTCYRAAGWLHLGQTAGCSRNERTQHEGVDVKEVFVHPLCARARERLRGGRSTARSKKDGGWAEHEFAGAELGDRRLARRLVEVGRDFFAHPQANIPHASHSAKRARAAYRLLDHPELGMKEFLSAHVRATTERAAAEKVVLAVQDTTSLNYTGIKDVCAGLGPVGTRTSGARGLIVHDTVVFTPQGLPLGVLDAQVWARAGEKTSRPAREIAEKESIKWLHSYEQASRLAVDCGTGTTVVSVGDREADLYELFIEAHGRRTGAHLLVRACQNRRIRSEEYALLFDYLHGLDAAGEYDVAVAAGPKRHARVARLSVRFSTVTLRPPRGKAALGVVELHAVLVREEDPPRDEPALEWILLTTLPVDDLRSACEKIDWYSVRWAIEVFHRTLKSGCRMEDRQLENASRLENCLAIDMVVAWRILHLRHLSRVDPDAPCTVYFEPHQWEALYAVTTPHQPRPTEPITIRQATRLVAMLGGFLARKSDGEPGAETLWRGLQTLDAICIGWLAAHRALGRDP